MRIRTFWETGVKVIPDDLNAIHDSTELDSKHLIEALSGGISSILFDDHPPIVAHVPPDILVDVPAQRFAVNGVTEEIAVPVSLSFPDVPPAQHRVFFVIRRNEVTDSRDVLKETAGTLSVVSDTVVIRKTTTPRIEQTSSPDAVTPAPDPALGPDDIGFLEFCTIIWDGAVLTVVHNIGALYSFPGAGMAYAPHAIQHMPGGSDPIPEASLSGHPSGSDPGLMPYGSFAVLKNAIQQVNIESTSPFLTRANLGDNTPGNPKKVDLGLRIMPALLSIEDSGDWYLGLNFPSGPYAGTSGLPAQSDHRHPPSEMPLVIVPYDLDVDSSDLGQILDVPEFATIGIISHVQAYWVPPGKTYPMVECDWIETTAGTMGTRVHLHGSKTIKIETGEVGFVKMSTALKNYVVGETGGITWESQENGKIARSGKIFIRLFGER